MVEKASMEIIIPLWCIAICLICVGYAHYKKDYWVKKATTVAAVLCSFPLWPNFYWGETSLASPVQIVYRFDENRYLRLTGVGCEGGLWYIDERKGIYSEIVLGNSKLPLFKIVHPSQSYIVVPMKDLSAFHYSKDGGRTFRLGHIITDKEQTYAPSKMSGTNEQHIELFVVVEGQGFIKLKDGRLLTSSKPFGQGWGARYLPLDENSENIRAQHSYFKDIEPVLPKVENYQGWTHFRCDPTLKGTAKPNVIDRFQRKILRLEQNTIGYPIYWLLN